MTSPRVSFVVPCYRLAHLLGDCIGSILAQTFTDFELIVMDDCSPDNTADVARSFDDPRVRYVRNEANLGHLRNYNRGIELSKGEYVWLISADDRLRSPHVLERFVAVMDREPQVGFVFCPAITFDGRAEGSLFASHGPDDTIFRNRAFLERLLDGNCVAAPSGMVRRRGYDRIGLFPIDLPYAGDWYIWLALAVHFDVAYLGEPMVGYRVHDLNMTKTCMRDMDALIQEGLTIRWRLRPQVEQMEDRRAREWWARGLVNALGALLASAGDVEGVRVSLPAEQVEQSIRDHTRSRRDAAWIRSRAYAVAGDAHHARGDLDAARRAYARSLRADPRQPRTAAKVLLMSLGAPGAYLRRAVSASRSLVRLARS